MKPFGMNVQLVGTAKGQFCEYIDGIRYGYLLYNKPNILWEYFVK